MDNEMKIREDVYKKMEQEYKIFIEKVKLKTPEEIIRSSYEKVCKEEILSIFHPECEYYDIDKIKCLNKCENPLEEIYQGWMDSDAGLYQVIEDSTYNTLDMLVEEQKQKSKSYER